MRTGEPIDDAMFGGIFPSGTFTKRYGSKGVSMCTD